MGERTDQIEQQINRTRDELNDNFNELEEKVRTAFDWRAQFNQRPMTLLAVAFGGGIIASALLPSRSPRRKRYRGDRRNDAGRTNEKVSSAPNGKSKQAFTALDAFKGALVTVAARRLGGVVGDFLSGYREELRQVHQKRSGFYE